MSVKNELPKAKTNIRLNKEIPVLICCYHLDDCNNVNTEENNS